jgi:hypothetical protein
MTRNIELARARLRRAREVALVELGMIVVAKSGMVPLLFKSDLGVPDSSHVEGINKFAAFMASLSTPLLIALAAVAPLALIFGAGALMMGNRKALTIIGSTIGALALAASATGLIN